MKRIKNYFMKYGAPLATILLILCIPTTPAYAQDLQPWQIAYADYVRQLEDPIFTVFLLHDINNSGTPELIVLQSDVQYNELSRIYTFVNNQMVEVEIVSQGSWMGFGTALFAAGGITGGFHWPPEGSYGIIRFEGDAQQRDFTRHILVGNQLVADTSVTGQLICSIADYGPCDNFAAFNTWLVNGRQVSQAEFSVIFNEPSIPTFSTDPKWIEDSIHDAIFGWTGERPSHWQTLYQDLMWSISLFGDTREYLWRFGLHDIDNSGVPELIIQGSQGYASYLFSVRDNYARALEFGEGVSLSKILAGTGSILIRPHGNRPGLIRAIGNLYFQSLYFYVIKDDQLVLQATGVAHRSQHYDWEDSHTDFIINNKPATQQEFYYIFGLAGWDYNRDRNISMHPISWETIGLSLPDWQPTATRPNTPIAVRLNGQYILFDTPPVNIDGRVLVPLRAIFEALGAYPNWNGATQTVSATRDDITVALQIGNHTLMRNGQSIPIDVAPRIIDSRTLVPVRAIVEAFGVYARWDSDTQTVVLESH